MCGGVSGMGLAGMPSARRSPGPARPLWTRRASGTMYFRYHVPPVTDCCGGPVRCGGRRRCDLPLLKKSKPVVLTATRWEPQLVLASIQLQDAGRHPARGFLPYSMVRRDGPEFAASTDGARRGRLLRRQGWYYSMTTWLSAPAPLPGLGSPASFAGQRGPCGRAVFISQYKSDGPPGRPKSTGGWPATSAMSAMRRPTRRPASSLLD